MERYLAIGYFGYLGAMIGLGFLGDVFHITFLSKIATVLGLGFMTIMGVLIIGAMVYAIYAGLKRVL